MLEKANKFRSLANMSVHRITFTEAGRVPMIAPAMKTRQDEALRYAELARQGARVERSLVRDDLPRWSQFVHGEATVKVTFEFYRDGDGLSWVKGEFEVGAAMLCTRCSEVLEHAFTGQVELCIVATEVQASELASGYDVLVAPRDLVVVAEIVEDELLLAVPERLCVADPCERMLPHRYPVAGEVQVGPSPSLKESDRNNPFDVLAELKR
ncbi:MAG: YceD family protein [Gammaproteobacteria bacterium]|nr:YceD family protein [Gammaproteobacteria bacterium]